MSDSKPWSLESPTLSCGKLLHSDWFPTATNQLPDLTMLPKTPVLDIIARCTAHTLMGFTFLFNSTHTFWTLPLAITPRLCSLYSPATTMVYWHGHSPKLLTFQCAINSTPRISGLSPSHPPRRYAFEGLLENHVQPWRTSTSSHTARCSAKLKTLFSVILYVWKLNSPTCPTQNAPHHLYPHHDPFYRTPQSFVCSFNPGDLCPYS